MKHKAVSRSFLPSCVCTHGTRASVIARHGGIQVSFISAARSRGLGPRSNERVEPGFAIVRRTSNSLALPLLPLLKPPVPLFQEHAHDGLNRRSTARSSTFRIPPSNPAACRSPRTTHTPQQPTPILQREHEPAERHLQRRRTQSRSTPSCISTLFAFLHALYLNLLWSWAMNRAT